MIKRKTYTYRRGEIIDIEEYHDGKMVLSASVVAGIVSILTSVAGIPEVEGE